MNLTENHKDLIMLLKELGVDSQTVMAIMPAVEKEEKVQKILEEVLEMHNNKKITNQKVLKMITEL